MVRRTENQPYQLDLPFTRIGLPASRIVQALAPARQSDATDLSIPSVIDADPNRDSAAKRQNDRVKPDEKSGYHPLPSPLLMQAALSAILRPRRNKPPWPPVTARQKPKSQE